MKPRPAARDSLFQSPETADTVRRLHCRFQSHCLGVAMEEGWNGLSCVECEVDAPLNVLEERSDMEGMGRMWRASLSVSVLA